MIIDAASSLFIYDYCCYFFILCVLLLLFYHEDNKNEHQQEEENRRVIPAGLYVRETIMPKFLNNELLSPLESRYE